MSMMRHNKSIAEKRGNHLQSRTNGFCKNDKVCFICVSSGVQEGMISRYGNTFCITGKGIHGHQSYFSQKPNSTGYRCSTIVCLNKFLTKQSWFIDWTVFFLPSLTQYKILNKWTEVHYHIQCSRISLYMVWNDTPRHLCLLRPKWVKTQASQRILSKSRLG